MAGEAVKFRPLEASVQRAIVESLQWAGFDVLRTSQVQRAVGCDNGIPDLLVFHPFNRGVMLGLEVKRDKKAHVRVEQRALADKGAVRIVSSPEEALSAAIECLLSIQAPHPSRIIYKEKAERFLEQLRASRGQGGS